ncbi:MAG: hypothetical protein ACR2LR_27695 [Hassallia sp.]
MGLNAVFFWLQMAQPFRVVMSNCADKYRVGRTSKVAIASYFHLATPFSPYPSHCTGN